MEVFDRLHLKLLNTPTGTKLPISKKEFELYEEILIKQNNINHPFFCFRNKEGKQTLIGCGIAKKTNKKPVVQSEDEIWIGGESFNQNSGHKGQEWKEFSKQCYIAPTWGVYHNTNEHYLFVQKDIDQNIQDFLSYFDLKDSDSSPTSISPDILTDKTDPFFNTSNSQENRRDFKSTPNKQSWEDNVTKSLEAIENKDIEKIVMARKVSTISDYENTHHELFNQIYKSGHSSYFFYFRPCAQTAFLSVSPEKLFTYIEPTQQVHVDAIAGTRPRSNDEKEDNRLAQELLNSDKELSEHRFVKTQIEKALSNFGKLKVTQEEKILKLQYVQHLYSHYCLELKSKMTYDDLVMALHPTPAVGGSPKDMALKLIDKIEDFDRGWYAAPVGIITKENSECIVAIRSALFHNNQIHIYAGAGIVKNSNAQNEWTETENKMLNFLELLERPSIYDQKQAGPIEEIHIE